MKISASVYSYSGQPIEDVIHNLEQIGVDYFHIDCNDEPGVFDEIERVKNASDKPIDLHLITSKPEKYFTLLEKHRPQFVCFQYEDLPGGFEFPSIEGVAFGLAIRTETHISVFDEFSSSCDFVLIMATTPGRSGGQFDARNFSKVRSFMRRHSKKRVTVDGGVNAEVSFILRSYGVHTAVVGSYLAKSEKSAVSLNTLRHENVDSNYLVEDMMVSRAHLPIVTEDECSIENLLRTNESFRLGYVLIENDSEQLRGISTNADIRRALIRKLDDFGGLTGLDLINRQPLYISQKQTVKDMFDMLRSNDQLISYLPVVDENKRLKGAVNLHFLIKGEL